MLCYSMDQTISLFLLLTISISGKYSEKLISRIYTQCLCVGHDRAPCKTAEPIDMLFAKKILCCPKKSCIKRILAPPGEND